MGDTPRSRTAAQSLYDEMARKPSGASLAPACRPRRVAHTPGAQATALARLLQRPQPRPRTLRPPPRLRLQRHAACVTA